MNPGFTGKKTYLQKFNPRAYLETYYSDQEGACDSENHLSRVLKQLHETFTTGAVKGDTLIEIGTGPTIHTLLSACEVFKELIATDYCDQNRQQIEKWWKKEPGAFDWSPIVRYVCELEGHSVFSMVGNNCRTSESVLRYENLSSVTSVVKGKIF
ncbi:nicotinamide N-methyltransferase-like isoform X2 [Pleurodeles waltl]|uniref:nicotinamide N-methyltransferase-like isoform X2 n=1 Tax=Pleurodeles waltl TaxID=8319 RepID=UPI003709471E